MSQVAAPPRYRFSIAGLLLATPWIALVIGAWGEITDNSFLWHVRAGTLQMEAGRVLQADPFSFTRGGEQWLTQSWLAELLYGVFEQETGLGFVPWMILATASLTMVAIGLGAYRRSKSLTATAFTLILSTLALISFLVPRPVIFSYLLMSLVVLAWDRKVTRWAVPLLFWIWAAVHASFILGLGYVALSILGRRDWRSLEVAVVAGFATLMTAHGTGVLEFLLAFGENREGLEHISEWRRPELLEPVFLPLLGGVVFVAFGVIRQKISTEHMWLILPMVGLALTSVRAIPPAWIAIAPIVATALAGMTLGQSGRLSRTPAAIFLFAVFALPIVVAKPADLSATRFPLAASAHLTKVPVFHDDVVGGFLIWQDGLNRKVYLDDRAELYGGLLGEFVALRDGETDFAPVFARHNIGQALLRQGTELVTDLEKSGWDPVFEDETFVVLRP